MQPGDRPRFLSCLTGCAETYGKPVSDAALRLWWRVLATYDIGAVETAFAVHLADPDTGQFMPRPADIIRRMSGTSQDSALRAWSLVDRAVRSVGPWQSVVFDDETTMAVLRDMGGWIALCEKTDDAWPFVAKEFENRYRGYRQRGEVPGHPRRLIGFAEAQNAREGCEIAPPMLVGDPARVARVRASGNDRPMLSIVRASTEPLEMPERAAIMGESA